MLSSKSNSKKNIILSTVLGVILLIVLFLILNQLIFSKDGSDTTADIKNLFNSEQRSTKSLNTKVLSSEAFVNLRDNRAKQININNLQVGKKDPFVK